MTVHPDGVLIDPTLDERLRTDGWVVIDLLDDDELGGIGAAQRQLQGAEDSGLAIDFARANRQAMYDIHELLAPMWGRHLPRLFRSYRPVVSTFVVKHPGAGSEMLLHNEPTFVDPELGPCFNVWIPLVDVDASLDNGVLELVPGSQHLPFGLAGFDTPVLFRPFERYIRDFAVPMSVRAGQAVIYDTRMLHASQPNRSGEPRPAIAAAMAPIGAPLIHVVAVGRYERQVYEVDEAFFLEHHPMDVHSVISDRYRLVDQRCDGRPLSGSDVATALGGTVVPEPEVVVPADIVEALPEMSVFQLEEQPCSAGSDVAASVDLTLLPEAPPRDEWQLVQVHGESKLVTLRVGDRSGWVAEDASDSDQAGGAVTAGSLLLVVERGARARLEGELEGIVLEVLTAAMVSAGILLDGRVAQLEPGRRLRLSDGGDVLLWNDGACPLVLTIAERSLPSERSSLRRFLRQVGLLRSGQRSV